MKKMILLLLVVGSLITVGGMTLLYFAGSYEVEQVFENKSPFELEVERIVFNIDVNKESSLHPVKSETIPARNSKRLLFREWDYDGKAFNPCQRYKFYQLKPARTLYAEVDCKSINAGETVIIN